MGTQGFFTLEIKTCFTYGEADLNTNSKLLEYYDQNCKKIK